MEKETETTASIGEKDITKEEEAELSVVVEELSYEPGSSLQSDN